MDSETLEEVVARTPPPPPPPCPNSNDLSPIGKGKRTKRRRPYSPVSLPIKHAGEYDTTTTTNHRLSPTLSSDESTTTEEEDTAQCLILLAQGHFLTHSHSPNNNHNVKLKRHEGRAACMYACKTCNRAFPSFQALGGHRASHKKTKNEKKSLVVFSDEDDFPSPGSSNKKMPPPGSLQLANISAANAAATAAAGGGPKPIPSPRIHECSYCRAEFTSGQALGGHMRRHRAGQISTSSNPAAPSIEGPELEEPKKRRNGMPLDLNLPAPEDESQPFGFVGTKQRSPEKLTLSTTSNSPTLIDCHD
ncbi:hypothetical protein OROGR_026013 [Orobanche gracilis]